MTAAYPELEARFGRLGAVEEAIAVLHWDAAAMMPPGGGPARAEQLATLARIAHAKLVSDELGRVIELAVTSSRLATVSVPGRACHPSPNRKKGWR